MLRFILLLIIAGPGSYTLPLAVRYALKTIPTQIEDEGRRIQLFLDSILADHPVLEAGYCYPGAYYDELFISSSAKDEHDQTLQGNKEPVLLYNVRQISPGTKMYPPCYNCRKIQLECIMMDDGCIQCEKNSTACKWLYIRKDLVARKIRVDPYVPSVHFSRVVGMNKLTADTEIRDKLRRDDGVLCIGKDPVDLSAKLPCLIVRGIVDYGLNYPCFTTMDWQAYAVGVATAYALHVLDWIQEPLDHKDLDWIVQKEKISHLYQSGHSILEIRDWMGKTCGFDAT